MCGTYEPTITSSGRSKCRRCGNNGMILENGYCIRCDDVVFGNSKK